MAELDFDPTALMRLIINIGKQTMLLLREHVTAYLTELSRTSAVMPLLDPTAYREVAGNIPQHERLCRAFLAFQDEVRAIREEGRR